MHFLARALTLVLVAGAPLHGKPGRDLRSIQEKPYRPHGSVESVDCGGIAGISEVQPKGGELTVPGTVFVTSTASTLPLTVTAEVRTTLWDRTGRHELTSVHPVAVKLVGEGRTRSDPLAQVTLALSITQPSANGFALVAHPAGCSPKASSSGKAECEQVIATFQATSPHPRPIDVHTEVVNGQAISNEPCAGRSLTLELSPVAPAYEVEMAASLEGLAAGKGKKSVILNGDPDRQPPTTQISLYSSNFPMPPLFDYVVTVTALFSDGSRAETSGPIEVKSAKR